PVRVTVLANDRDPAGGTLTLASVTSGRTGQVKVNDDNTITYTPGSEATRDSFTYTVRNELGETAKATVNVTVETATTESPDPPSEPPNRPPVANTDQAQTDPGKSVTIRVLANDSDPDQGDQISIASVDGNTQAGGSVGDNGDGTLTYSPPPEFAGADRFTYTVRDRDGATATATVEVTINAPTPLPPPVANDDRAETAAGQTVTIQVLANDQGDDLEIAALDNSGRLGGGVGNNGDGTVNYTPPFDFSGVDTFRYSIRDRNGTQSEAATVSVLVEAVNNPPVANNDSTRHEYSGSPRAARLNVLANDSDPDGGTADLAIESVTQGQYTQVEISADRQAVIYTLTLPSVQASPNGVTDSFTYTIRDPNGAVSAPATVTVVGYHGPDSNPALTLPLATPSSP
ncbi:MAG: Ig-like domain-containing protein, partial [Cyanobacteria bacterium P01_A01_bin.114]